MSQYVCSAILSLGHYFINTANTQSGEINETIFAVNTSLFDKEYNHIAIDLYNAIGTGRVEIPIPLSKAIYM